MDLNLGGYRMGGISDKTLNVMANSDDPTLRAQAQAIVDASKKQQQQLGFFQKLGNFLGNKFGMSKAGAAEPDDFDMFASLRSNQISSFDRPNISDIAGITNTPQASLFTSDQAALLGDTDDAGLEEEYYEQFPETGTIRSGIQSLFNKVRGSRIAQAFLGTINPIFGGIAGLAGGFPGIRGGVGLRGDTTLDTFRRSTTLADFAQRMRDKRAREDAARRGSIKDLQSRIDRGDFDGNGNTDTGPKDTSGASGGAPGGGADAANY